jgi:hypothetical protein
LTVHAAMSQIIVNLRLDTTRDRAVGQKAVDAVR